MVVRMTPVNPFAIAERVALAGKRKNLRHFYTIELAHSLPCERVKYTKPVVLPLRIRGEGPNEKETP